MNRGADLEGYGTCEMCVLLKEDSGVCIQGRLWFNGVVSCGVEGKIVPFWEGQGSFECGSDGSRLNTRGGGKSEGGL